MASAKRKRALGPRQYSTDLEKVVVRTALVENMLNQVITNFCAPRKGLNGFFWDVILDTSVMSLGARVKVAMAVAHSLKFELNRNSLHRVLSLRNAFAHHTTDSHPVFEVARPPARGRVYYRIQVLESDGSLTHIERKEALTQFDTEFVRAKESIRELLLAIKSAVPSAAA